MALASVPGETDAARAHALGMHRTSYWRAKSKASALRDPYALAAAVGVPWEFIVSGPDAMLASMLVDTVGRALTVACECGAGVGRECIPNGVHARRAYGGRLWSAGLLRRAPGGFTYSREW